MHSRCRSCLASYLGLKGLFVVGADRKFIRGDADVECGRMKSKEPTSDASLYSEITWGECIVLYKCGERNRK